MNTLKSLFLEYSPDKMIENNKEWFEKNREFNLEFQSSQTQKRGLLHKQFPYNPIKGWTIGISKQSELMDNPLIFRSGTSLLVSNSILKIFDKLHLPKHQIWDANVALRGRQLNEYYLLYFYFDYFHLLDFPNCVFEVYTPELISEVRYQKGSYKDTLTEPNKRFNSFEEYCDWYEVNEYQNTRTHWRERPVLRRKTFQFIEEVYKLDIIPSNKLDYRFFISERLADFLLMKNTRYIEIFDCTSSLTYP